MSDRTTHSQTYPKFPLTDEELQLVADVGGLPVEKVRAIVNLAAKALIDKGGFILTGGKMVRTGSSAAWNLRVQAETTPDNEV